MAEPSTTSPKSRRRIIERPRLTRLLDESPARIKMLVAPAGYGKTTLARQWLAAGSRRSAWYVCRRSSADVAALAEGAVMSARSVIPDFGSAILDRLAATGVPAHEVDVLAEMMLEDLQRWPSDAWLVIDEYHLISDSPAAQLLLGEIAGSVYLNLLVISRSRPVWATARRVIYGEIFDVGREALEMTQQEAETLLRAAEPPSEQPRTLESRWPALLGLAALTGGIPDGTDVPSAIYDFLADELFASLSAEAKEAALAIVPMPRMDRETAGELLGDRAGVAVAEGAAAGMLDLSESGGLIEMHPLVRHFLLTRRNVQTEKQTERLLTILLEKRRWDDAFSLIQEFLPHRLEELLRAALPDLLAKSRVQTLATWLAFSDEAGIRGAACDYAAAELAFREGAHLEVFAAAQALARRLPDQDELKTRALLLVGRSAHLASLEQEALDAYRAAKDLARARELRRMAIWGEVSAAIDLELSEAERLLADAERECDTLFDVLYHASQTLAYGIRYGKIIGLEKAHALVPLYERVSDPLMRCSFLNGLSSTLAVAGQYEECLRITELLLSEARRDRLDFVVSYALATRAICRAALHDRDEALQLLDGAREGARTQLDKHSLLNAEAIRCRVHFAAGRFADALAALETDVHGAIPSMAAEISACRGLVLAALGRTTEARQAAQAASISSSVETLVLVSGVDAICASREGLPDAPASVRRLITTAFESGNIDSLVTIYRGTPEVMAHTPDDLIDPVVSLLRRMQDDDLEAIVHASREKQRRPATVLSPRERDVAELLRQGLTNKEIAARLFISPATAKLHVRHILEKLGVRTRTEAALRLSGRTYDG